MSKITSITPRLFVVPLPEVLTDDRHGDHTHFQLVTATVTLEDGSQGTGYTYTGWMEVHSFEIDRYTRRPLLLDNHRAVAPDSPGIGVEFDWQALAPFQAAGAPGMKD